LVNALPAIVPPSATFFIAKSTSTCRCLTSPLPHTTSLNFLQKRSETLTPWISPSTYPRIGERIMIENRIWWLDYLQDGVGGMTGHRTKMTQV
jgi:hypothetical protein